MKELMNKKVSVEKIEDTVYNGNHPNDINTGYNVIGIVKMTSPALFIERENERYFHTSNIVSHEKDGDSYILHTLNSIYKVTIVE